MKELQNFNFTTKPRHSHDWDTILNGSIWQMVKGKDFNGEPKNFKTAIMTRAKAMKKKVRVQVDGDSVILQAYNEDN